eukprot:Rhum_TRINITY_DN14483_c8_g3::Rhum_TRINITY_DN14483_c8_g3_i1::g.87522::m.87522
MTAAEQAVAAVQLAVQVQHRRRDEELRHRQLGDKGLVVLVRREQLLEQVGRRLCDVLARPLQLLAQGDVLVQAVVQLRDGLLCSVVARHLHEVLHVFQGHQLRHLLEGEVERQKDVRGVPQTLLDAGAQGLHHRLLRVDHDKLRGQHLDHCVRRLDEKLAVRLRHEVLHRQLRGSTDGNVSQLRVGLRLQALVRFIHRVCGGLDQHRSVAVPDVGIHGDRKGAQPPRLLQLVSTGRVVVLGVLRKVLLLRLLLLLDLLLLLLLCVQLLHLQRGRRVLRLLRRRRRRLLQVPHVLLAQLRLRRRGGQRRRVAAAQADRRAGGAAGGGRALDVEVVRVLVVRLGPDLLQLLLLRGTLPDVVDQLVDVERQRLAQDFDLELQRQLHVRELVDVHKHLEDAHDVRVGRLEDARLSRVLHHLRHERRNGDQLAFLHARDQKLAEVQVACEKRLVLRDRLQTDPAAQVLQQRALAAVRRDLGGGKQGAHGGVRRLHHRRLQLLVSHDLQQAAVQAVEVRLKADALHDEVLREVRVPLLLQHGLQLCSARRHLRLVEVVHEERALVHERRRRSDTAAQVLLRLFLGQRGDVVLVKARQVRGAVVRLARRLRRSRRLRHHRGLLLLRLSGRSRLLLLLLRRRHASGDRLHHGRGQPRDGRKLLAVVLPLRKPRVEAVERLEGKLAFVRLAALCQRVEHEPECLPRALLVEQVRLHKAAEQTRRQRQLLRRKLVNVAELVEHGPDQALVLRGLLLPPLGHPSHQPLDADTLLVQTLHEGLHALLRVRHRRLLRRHGGRSGHGGRRRQAALQGGDGGGGRHRRRRRRGGRVVLGCGVAGSSGQGRRGAVGRCGGGGRGNGRRTRAAGEQPGQELRLDERSELARAEDGANAVRERARDGPGRNALEPLRRGVLEERVGQRLAHQLEEQHVVAGDGDERQQQRGVVVQLRAADLRVPLADGAPLDAGGEPGLDGGRRQVQGGDDLRGVLVQHSLHDGDDQVEEVCRDFLHLAEAEEQHRRVVDEGTALQRRLQQVAVVRARARVEEGLDVVNGLPRLVARAQPVVVLHPLRLEVAALVGELQQQRQAHLVALARQRDVHAPRHRPLEDLDQQLHVHALRLRLRRQTRERLQDRRPAEVLVHLLPQALRKRRVVPPLGGDVGDALRHLLGRHGEALEQLLHDGRVVAGARPLVADGGRQRGDGALARAEDLRKLARHVLQVRAGGEGVGEVSEQVDDVRVQPGRGRHPLDDLGCLVDARVPDVRKRREAEDEADVQAVAQPRLRRAPGDVAVRLLRHVGRRDVGGEEAGPVQDGGNLLDHRGPSQHRLRQHVLHDGSPAGPPSLVPHALQRLLDEEDDHRDVLPWAFRDARLDLLLDVVPVSLAARHRLRKLLQPFFVSCHRGLRPHRQPVPSPRS